MSDPAEAETEERRRLGFASSFDQLTHSNLQLIRTVRTSIVIVSTIAVMSFGWTAITTYSMRSTQLEMRGMLQAVLEHLTSRP